MPMLSGCDIHDASPASSLAPAEHSTRGIWGLATPPRIGAFERVSVGGTETGAVGEVAGYGHPVGADTVVATIRVHQIETNTLIPFADLGGGITADASKSALDGSIAQVRRFYPKVEIVSERPAFLLQHGAIQNGRYALLAYRELHGGQERTTRLRIYTFCCGDGRWGYEYRFRYPQAVDDDEAIADFMRTSDWRPPHAS